MTVGCRVRLARRQHDLAGVQQLAELEQRRPSGSRSASIVWLPLHADVDAPHLARPLAEPGRAGEQQRRVLVRRAPAPVLGERTPRRATAGEPGGTRAPSGPWNVQQLAGVLRQGQRDHQAVEQVRPSPIVRHLPGTVQCPVAELERDVEHADRRRRRPARSTSVLPAVLRDESARSAATSARPRGSPSRPGPAREAAAVLGHDETGATTSGAPATDGRRASDSCRRGRPRRRAAPPVHDRAGARRHVDDDVGCPARRWISAQPLLAPSVRPLMKCCCRAMYTTSVGRAIIIDAAAIRLSSLQN